MLNVLLYHHLRSGFRKSSRRTQKELLETRRNLKESAGTWKYLKKTEVQKAWSSNNSKKNHKYDTYICIVEQFDFLKYSDAISPTSSSQQLPAFCYLTRAIHFFVSLSKMSNQEKFLDFSYPWSDQLLRNLKEWMNGLTDEQTNVQLAYACRALSL